MLPSLRALLGASLFCVLSSVALAEEPPLRIASDVPFPPYEMLTADGEFTGFEVELVNAICERMQRRCEWQAQSFDGIIPGLLARKYDIIASSMLMTPARQQQVSFAKAYYFNPSVWVGPADRPLEVDEQTDLSGKRVGVQRASVQDDYVTATHPEADIRRYTTVDTVAVDMQTGRLDLIFANLPQAQALLLGDAAYAIQGEPVRGPEAIFGKGTSAAFRKRDTALVEAFNRGLDEVMADGTYDEIMRRYFDYDIHPTQ
ncbi:transporter substrate-binding domain-containing protein [Halotalea alkalilenta]|uniref:transporter substrate-binding domain-containing protein n=1 Tax=Halotalea alkalilenta TaxID=376489 RepID=UPI0005BCE2A8|nr:transporter substrate-binding domain-containing protein [Halotalea alkalilenta]